MNPLQNVLGIKSVILLGSLAAVIAVTSVLAAESPRTACRKAASAQYRLDAATCNLNADATRARLCIRSARSEYRARKKTCPAG